jgi:hypothetical protein
LVPQPLDLARRGTIGPNVNRYRHLLNKLETKVHSSLAERWPSAMGLGRVITRRRRYRRAATGGMCCKVTISNIFFRFRVREASWFITRPT